MLQRTSTRVGGILTIEIRRGVHAGRVVSVGRRGRAFSNGFVRAVLRWWSYESDVRCDQSIEGRERLPSAGAGGALDVFVKFLIVLCRSDRSCCSARHNRSSLSSLISACRFSFSSSFICEATNESISAPSEENDRSRLRWTCVCYPRRFPIDVGSRCVPSRAS